MKTYYIILAAALITACATKTLKTADSQYQHEQYRSAAVNYEQALTTSTEKDPRVMLRLADCYREMNRYAEAANWYEQSIHSSVATPQDKLHYAEVLKALGKCDEADKMLSEYLSEVPSDSVAKRQKVSCERPFDNADKLYTVKKMEYGCAGSCFSPVKINDNSMLITASAPVKAGAPVDDHTGKGFYNLYVVSAKDGHSIPEEASLITDEPTIPGVVQPTSIPLMPGVSTTPAGMPTTTERKTDFLTPASYNLVEVSEINSDYHEGAAVVSPDGQKLFFTRSKMKNNQPMKTLDNVNHLELCEASLADGKWGNVTPLPFNNNKEYSVGHPAITSDGTRLYFICDKPGGYGGTDIYYSDYANGKWGNMVNAGALINTSGNEMFPVIRKLKDGKEIFYFSSNGWPGEGGLDIFKSEMKDKLPGKPQRLTSPVNSSHDDFGVYYNEDGISGYVSSNRGNDEGEDNIFAFNRKPNSFYVDAKVFWAETDQPAQGMPVEVQTAPKLNSLTRVDTMKTDTSGTIFFRADSMTVYSFMARQEGYFAGTAVADVGGYDGKLSDTIHLKLYMSPIVLNKPIRLDNIYYDFDKWNIRPDAAVELDKLVKIMKDNPNIKVELGSHCDSRGSNSYNMRLSQRRAQSAVDYIVSQGISSDRITAHGYGESVLLNRCSDGVQCSEEEHQLNRRTEFKVIEIIGAPQSPPQGTLQK